ncbi:MAG: glycosyltransferase [Ignavibacteria bacterium]|nr:glycosyltransferase [Ignavibacteria bacterium]
MNKIKLVHIISNLSLGGAQILLLDILKNLNRDGQMEIKVICLDSGEFVKNFIDNGIDVIDLKEKGLLNFKILFKLKKILKNTNPDIVHTHLNKADFYGRVAAKQSGVKHIFSTCHNYSSHHEGADINSISLFDRIDNAVIKYSDSYIVAISEIVKQFIINRDSNFKNRTEVIYNGIDVSKEVFVTSDESRRTLRKSLNINEDDFVILISGRLEKQKGHLFFIKSMQNILKSKKNIKLLIIGDGNLKEEIIDLISEFDLNEFIILTGFLKNTEVYIEICDMVAVPSLWEGFGLVILEGMIKRKPVLASNVGGIPEIIEDGINGYLFESENEKSLQEKFLNLYVAISEYKNEIDFIKKNAMITLKDKFDISKNSELYRQLYYRKLKLNL